MASSIKDVGRDQPAHSFLPLPIIPMLVIREEMPMDLIRIIHHRRQRSDNLPCLRCPIHHSANLSLTIPTAHPRKNKFIEKGQMANLRITDQSTGHKAKQARIRLRRLTAAQDKEHPVRTPGAAFATGSGEEGVDVVPDLGLEFCDFGRRETAGALAVQGGGHLAVAELANEEFDREGEGGEGLVAHGVVVLFPAFVGLWGGFSCCFMVQAILHASSLPIDSSRIENSEETYLMRDTSIDEKERRKRT